MGVLWPGVNRGEENWSVWMPVERSLQGEQKQAGRKAGPAWEDRGTLGGCLCRRLEGGTMTVVEGKG